MRKVVGTIYPYGTIPLRAAQFTKRKIDIKSTCDVCSKAHPQQKMHF